MLKVLGTEGLFAHGKRPVTGYVARTLSTRRKKMAGMDNRRTDGRREDGKTLWYAARVVTWEPEVEEEEEEGRGE